MNKQSRHLTIRQIIAQQSIGTQEELVRALNDAGFHVTQATLSRDLKELGVARVNASGGPRYIIPAGSEENRLKEFISYEIISIESNESMIVIRTLPGRAQGVAEIIDRLPDSGILGTLAGDNTIFVAPVSVRKIAAVLGIIRELVK